MKTTLRSSRPSIISNTISRNNNRILITRRTSPSTRFSINNMSSTPYLMKVKGSLRRRPTTLLICKRMTRLISSRGSNLTSTHRFPIRPILLLNTTRARRRSNHNRRTRQSTPLTNRPSSHSNRITLTNTSKPMRRRILTSNSRIRILRLHTPPINKRLRINPIVTIRNLINKRTNLFRRTRTFKSLTQIRFNHRPSFSRIRLIKHNLNRHTNRRTTYRNRTTTRLRSTFTFLNHKHTPTSNLQSRQVKSSTRHSSPPSSIPIVGQS